MLPVRSCSRKNGLEPPGDPYQFALIQLAAQLTCNSLPRPIRTGVHSNMTKIKPAILAFLVLGAVVVWSQPAKPAAHQQQRRTLEVQVHYTGSGAVSDGHKIYVALWASANFVDSGEAPISVGRAVSKDDVVVFPDVQRPTVYVSAAYDPSGKWDAQTEPPSDASLGILSKDPPKPDAVDLQPGQTVRVTLNFDDSVKVR